MSPTYEQVIQARSNAQEQLDEIDSAAALDRKRLVEAIEKFDNWLWNNTEHKADTVIAEFVSLRDQRAALKEQYDTADKKLKAEMEKRDAWLLAKIEADGLESIRTEHGTAYTQEKTRYNVADWTSYWAWLLENQRLDLLEKRPAQGPLAKMAEAGEELPPGLNLFTERTVTVRRA